MSKKSPSLHPKIKESLGYPGDMADLEVLDHWKERSTQVCKPCWELKYCPYGPLVEQMPLLPSLKDDAVRHNDGIKDCLETNGLGGARELDSETRDRYVELVSAAEEDPSVLAAYVARGLYVEKGMQEALEAEGDPDAFWRSPRGNFESYQLPWPLNETEGEEAEVELTPELRREVAMKLEELRLAVSTGVEGNTRPLSPARRVAFQNQVDGFNPDDYPTSIPESITCMECNIFGHICPVVFVAERITETTEERRRGRYLSFKVKMRVVRRDNHTCQECGKHLRDDEVEFDHIIPVSRGGSSEEHNIRLTCFGCNRKKAAIVDV